MKTQIPKLRKQNKLSQEELTQTVGVTQQTITSVECKKYTASLVLTYKVIIFFGRAIKEVFNFSDV